MHNPFYWWHVRITLVVSFGFSPQNFGRMVGPMNDTLSFYEGRFSGGDTMRWWVHRTPISYKRIVQTFCAHRQQGRKNFSRERHRSRPNHLVKLSLLFCFLGVPTLMSRMLDAEELDFSFGQTDSLTHRLNVLLQDYTDGFAVPKELVQNADDAGATEVRSLPV